MTDFSNESSPLVAEKKGGRIWLLVLAAALLVRLLVALLLGDVAAPISGAADQYSYDVLAQRVLGGYGFSFPDIWYPFLRPDTPTAHWSFLYTLYLAGVYALFGHHPLAARLIQLLVSGLGIWLAYRLGRRLFGEGAGVAAAALTGGYAYLVFFNAALMTQTFYIIALLAALDVSLSLAERPSWRGWLWLGLALGLGALLRQTLLLFAPVLFGWLWWTWRGRASHPAGPALRPRGPPLFKGMLLSLGVIALLILPWTLRNYLVYHDFLLLNSNGGYWFYSSNHPLQGTDFDQNLVAPIPASLEGTPEPALDRALYREALGFIVADPHRFVLLSISRLKDYFWILPSGDSTPLSNLSRLFSFPLYLPFMLYGLVLSRKQWRACLPFYLYVLFDAALCLISWSAPRYRLPSDALLMPFAGLALASLVGFLRSKPATRALATIRSGPAVNRYVAPAEPAPELPGKER